jgi:hypothetical protein
MFTDHVGTSKCRIHFAVAVVSSLMVATIGNTASAGTLSNNGAPSTTATVPGPTNDVRDHRAQHSGPPPPHSQCHKSPYSGQWVGDCAGVTIRDHRK